MIEGFAPQETICIGVQIEAAKTKQNVEELVLK